MVTDGGSHTPESELRPFGGFRPHIEYFGANTGDRTLNVNQPVPPDFYRRFRTISERVYPQDRIQHIKADGYNPTIIGYSHANPAEREAIIKRLTFLKQLSGKKLKALQEIDPQQLGWIRDFLKMEQELKEQGTVNGKPALSSEKAGMDAYRLRLSGNNAEHLALWYLENGVDVESIEHPDVKKWISDDKSAFDEESFGSVGATTQPFQTAIRRDIHGLSLIDEQRPDIISVGAMHALKFDMLLERDGQNSFYYLNKPLNWEEIIKKWESAHNQFDRKK